MHTEKNKHNQSKCDVIYGDGVITFANRNTTIGFVRYNEHAEIEYIFVNPIYRKRGYGSQLVQLVEKLTSQTPVPQEPISPLGKILFKID